MDFFRTLALYLLLFLRDVVSFLSDRLEVNPDGDILFQLDSDWTLRNDAGTTWLLVREDPRGTMYAYRVPVASVDRWCRLVTVREKGPTGVTYVLSKEWEMTGNLGDKLEIGEDGD